MDHEIYETDIYDKTRIRHISILCDCEHPEHQFILSYFVGDKTEMFMDIHLADRGFWLGLIYAIKYIFGYRSRYGAFDEIILNADTVHILKNFVFEFMNQPTTSNQTTGTGNIVRNE